ncbi:MAG: RNA polymerase sigma-54 factor [Acidobacteria bacterium]|nr:RNA polymerase sigma-54 factor [Acidobacteriota bacterium]
MTATVTSLSGQRLYLQVMTLKPSLSTNLSQRLVLTPQLRQRIEMLQMNKLELNDLVIQQLTENPILEELPPEDLTVSPDLANNDFDGTSFSSNFENGELSGEAAGAMTGLLGEGNEYGNEIAPNLGDLLATEHHGTDSVSPPATAVEGEGGESRELEIGERDSFEEIDFGSAFEDYLDPGYRTREIEVKESHSLEQFLSTQGSLADYLNWQLRMTVTSPLVSAVAEVIIGCLNDDGFLEVPLEEIAAYGSWTMESVESALEVVQQFDPAGVAARNLGECLAIQLNQLGCGARLAARLVQDHLNKLHNHKLPELARELGLPVEELVEELKLLRRLDPWPGRKFAPRSHQYVEPEIYIEKIEDGYLIHFNDDGLPQLRINREYRQMMENKETSKETRDYIKDRYRSAVDLIKNIEHRKQTIYRVCERIIERQRDFLEHGVEQIKPMMLKDIAEDIGMHLSTVSRVVNGKYAHTPQGVIELRRFFTEGMTNDDGEAVSTQIIKLRIRKMIEAEDTRTPLTDDQIAERLASEGQKLSRRAVAKYRDQMRIPGSRERRQVV